MINCYTVQQLDGTKNSTKIKEDSTKMVQKWCHMFVELHKTFFGI
jgi:hypothetical protein